jgi:hypothetical protein
MLRISTVGGDANLSRVKALLDQSIKHFQRSFYTYGKVYSSTKKIRLLAGLSYEFAVEITIIISTITTTITKTTKTNGIGTAHHQSP